MNTWIAVDGGQSAVRVRVSWADDVRTGPGFRHGGDPVEVVTAELLPILADLSAPAPVDRIVVGHTGLPPDPADQERIATAVADVVGTTAVRLLPDWITGHVGALAGEPGIALVGGTGAVCRGVSPDGRTATVDGWGHLLGDRGSAFAIGRAGLAHALAQYDGREPAGPLLVAARDFLTALHDRDPTSTDEPRADPALEAGLWQLYGSVERTDRIARFAPSVTAAAEQDPTAAAIVDQAVDDLADTVVACSRVLAGPPTAIAFCGGLLAPGGPIRRRLDPLIAERLPDWQLREPAGDPLAGAVRLASDDPTAERGLRS